MENECMNWKVPAIDDIETVTFFFLARLSAVHPTGANVTVVDAANFHSN